MSIFSVLSVYVTETASKLSGRAQHDAEGGLLAPFASGELWEHASIIPRWALVRAAQEAVEMRAIHGVAALSCDAVVVDAAVEGAPAELCGHSERPHPTP